MKTLNLNLDYDEISSISTLEKIINIIYQQALESKEDSLTIIYKDISNKRLSNNILRTIYKVNESQLKVFYKNDSFNFEYFIEETSIDKMVIRFRYQDDKIEQYIANNVSMIKNLKFIAIDSDTKEELDNLLQDILSLSCEKLIDFEDIKRRVSKKINIAMSIAFNDED